MDRGLRVLHVEDDEDAAFLVRHHLLDQPYVDIDTIEVCPTRADLLRTVIEDEPFDVILVDFHLPDGNGYDVLEDISRHSPTSTSILVTSIDETLLGVGALHRGASDLVPKSALSSETLTRAIRFGLERQRHIVDLRAQANTDALTGLANRRGLELCHEMLAGTARREGMRLAAIVADVDEFKAVNDEHGHAHGDEVLRTIADVLRGMTRGADCAARMGGDEFGLLVVVADESTAAQVTERMTDALERHRQDRGVRVSIGFAIGHPDTALDDLIAEADRAMYLDKAAARRSRQRS